MTDFSILVGKTLTSIDCEEGSDSVLFTTDSGDRFQLLHHQDCCENVYLEDVEGDVSDLIGSPILVAEEASNIGFPDDPEFAESFTWTFYRIATARGWVVLRWLGTSNGYYSERVDFEQL